MYIFCLQTLLFSTRSVHTVFPNRSSHNCPIPDATIATHVRRFTELLDLEWKNALVQEKVVIQENVQIQWRPIDKTNRTEALFTLENNETEISVNDVLDIKHCLSGWRNHGFVRSVDGKTIHLKMAKNFKKTDQTSGFAILLGLNIGLFARMKEALSNFANNDMHETIRKMIAGNVDQTANVIQIDPNLVQNQTPPVAYALGHRLTLIQGSNLTAKCETVLKIVFQLIKTECKDKRAPKILVCSPSDVALDSMAIKISQLGCDVVRVYHPALESKSLPASHLGLHNLVRENRNQQNENRYDKYIRSKQNVGETIEDLEKRKSVVLIDLKKKVLNASRVFCMTCYDAGMELLKQMPHLKFNTVLIDEACQTSELETLIAAAKASQRLILIGGQMQASPRGSNLDDDFFDLSTSLFERLVKSGVKPQLLEMNQ